MLVTIIALVRRNLIAMKTLERPEDSGSPSEAQSNGNSNALSKLRLLLSDLISEVELLDRNAHSLSRIEHLDNSGVCFYDEVAKFEIALIKSALRLAHGNQVQAARLLNLHPSTLHTKIKQFRIKHTLG